MPDPLDYVPIADWDDIDCPPQEWTVKERIPRRQVTLFSGEGGVGKSTIGLHLCAAHVLGRDCLTELPEQGPAMFLDPEDELTVIHRRLDAIRRHYDTTYSALSQGGLHILSLAGKEPLLARESKGLIVPTDLYHAILKDAAQIKPQTIVVSSAANVFAGNELDRSHVTQFINLLTRLAIAANGSVILIAHPSLAGIKEDTGLSGSTGWHNAVRARIFLKSVKANGGEAADPDVKILEWRKNQYGPPAAAIALRWRDGMFLVDHSEPSGFEKAAQEAREEHVVEQIVARYEREGVAASSNPNAKTFAPGLFAKEPEAVLAKLTKNAIHLAMRRLIDKGRLANIAYGKASNPHSRLHLQP
jgi:RecA-family ATPase